MPKEVNEFEVTKKEVQHHINTINEWVDKGAKKPLKFRQLSPNWTYRTVEFLPKVDILGELETNGWEGDWWQSFRYKGKVYQMSGSAHYGYAQIALSEEQDD